MGCGGVTSANTKQELVTRLVDFQRKTLATPSGLKWTGATASWTAVPNATSYKVQLYKDNAVSGDAVTVAAPSKDFTANITETGAYTFTVQSVGDAVRFTTGSVSGKSQAYNYTKG